MTKAKPEWAESINGSILAAYDRGEIQTFKDFDKVFLEAWSFLQIDEGQLRGGVLRSVKATSPVVVALRKKEAEVHRPITNDSPIGHLPISMRTNYLLRREGLRWVGNIIDFLRRYGKDGLLSIRYMGSESIAGLYDALEWARIEIPQFEGVEATGATRGTADSRDTEAAKRAGEGMSLCLWEGFEEIGKEEKLIPLTIKQFELRRIYLEPEELFKTEFSAENTGEAIIIFQGKQLIINARRITIEAEG